METNKRSLIRDIALIIVSATIYSLNMKSFVNAGNLVPGGFSGLSVLISRSAAQFFNLKISYGLLYALFNVPCAILVYKTVGKRFTYLSVLDFMLVSLFTDLFPTFNVTSDMLLITVFGGILGGLAGTLVLSSGGCGGGTDFISIYYAKKKQKSMWNTILIMNVGMLLISGFIFGWESALYSIIFQFVQTQVIDLFDKRYKRSCFLIVTDKAEEVMVEIRKNFRHNSTELFGIGYYTKQEKKIVYTVVGRYEQQQVLNLVLSIDPNAFINVMNSEKLVGRFNELPY